MTTWYDYVQKTGKLPRWPYEIRYGKVKQVTSDVLVIGGGVAGCRAAISAARSGAVVAVAERGHAKRSGAYLAIINRDPTPLDELADVVLRMPIGQTLSAIAEAMSGS